MFNKIISGLGPIPFRLKDVYSSNQEKKRLSLFYFSLTEREKEKEKVKNMVVD